MKYSKNLANCTFGQLLSQLLSISHQKSYVLANYLNYDVSYISKWVTGTMFPAARHADSMCMEISNFIMENTEEQALEELLSLYGVETLSTLRDEIYRSLIKAYRQNDVKKEKSKAELISDENNSRTVINPHLQKLYLKFYPDIINNSSEKFHIAMMIDLLALGKEDKLSIARIKADTAFTSLTDEIHCLISLTKELIDDSFDALLITYLLNNYADLNYTLSHYHRVPCSIMLSIRDFGMHLSIVGQNHRAILSNTSHDRVLANEMYDTIISAEHSFTTPLVRATTMAGILRENQYLGFAISSNISIFCTTMDELFLPTDVFEELLTRIDSEKYDIELFRRLHLMFQNAMQSSQIRVAILDKSLQEYALHGEIDFYGLSLTLTVEQRQRHMKHLFEIFKKESSNVTIRLFTTSILKDFDYDFAPCVYLSDILSYVRLRACTQNGRVDVIESMELKDIYQRFLNHYFKTSIPDFPAMQGQFISYLNMLQILKY